MKITAELKNYIKDKANKRIAKVQEAKAERIRKQFRGQLLALTRMDKRHKIAYKKNDALLARAKANVQRHLPKGFEVYDDYHDEYYIRGNAEVEGNLVNNVILRIQYSDAKIGDIDKVIAKALDEVIGA
jgi:hypothetical protein